MSSAGKPKDTADNKDAIASSNVPTVASPSPPPPPPPKAQIKLMSRFCVSIEDDPIILLNIGGVNLSTRRSTLTCIPNTVLALACTEPWFEKITRDNDGRLYFDFDPNLFQYLINQLREWSPKRKVFDLPRNEYDRQRFSLLCYQLNFPRDLTDGIHRHEKFNKVCGHILLDKHSSIAIHAGSYRHSECRGMNVYSSGINRIVLVLKYDSMEKYNTFIGIIWSATPMQERSFESTTAYGWGSDKQVFFKGQLSSCAEGYGGYDSDICTDDTIELTLNCQLSLISMYNHRTKKIYQLPIDTREGCPFPWQLHINLYAPNDRVKIINPE